MRLFPAFLLAVSALAASGCTSPGDLAVPLPHAGLDGGLQASMEGEAQAPSSGGHGEPQRAEGPVETGLDPTQVPMAWARQAITITNDMGGSLAASVAVHNDAGRVVVQPGTGDGYRVEAVLEARGLTEQDAQDALARLQLVHLDRMERGRLVTETRAEREPSVEPLPGIRLGHDNSWIDLTVFLPRGVAYDLYAGSASGSVAVTGLAGASLVGDTASGAVEMADLDARHVGASSASGSVVARSIRAGTLDLDTASGSIVGEGIAAGTVSAHSASGSLRLAGVIDTLEADTSSGSMRIEAHGARSGAYSLDAASGSIDLTVLDDKARAYRVAASSASGSVDVDLEESRTTSEDEGELEVESRDFRRAAIRTAVDASTASGSITVRG